MVKIYTKKGDLGKTSLVGGTEVSKSDPQVDLYGFLDDLNSLVGYSSVLVGKKHLMVEEQLTQIQRDLFTIQTIVACEFEKYAEYKTDGVGIERVDQLEIWIDKMSKELKPLTKFILPGGSAEAASLHICRTNCRNLERRLVAFCDVHGDKILKKERQYINRLSDYFFIAARYSNLILCIEDKIYE